MRFVDLSRLNAAELAASWRDARPFPHVVIDDFLAPARLQELREAVAREPHQPNTLDFYELMGSGNTMQHATLLEMAAEMGAPETLAVVGEITGKRPQAIEMRSYVYLAGSYLLPHTDHRAEMKRIISYALYLVGSTTCTGGELELYATRVDEADDVVAAEPARRIAPKENRLVLFDVSPVSLHEVREVTSGGRVSLAGWFLS